jgi:uncharacterized protein YndB with AHSA1/START domain
MSEPLTPAADGPTVDHVLVEVTVPAPADVVWAALRDPRKIEHWFGWDADSLADEVEFIFFTYGRADDAARVLDFEGVPDRYELEDRGDHTIVRLIRSAPAAGEDWTGVFEDMTEGWIAVTEQLRFMMARHFGQTRRTLYFGGEPRTGALNGAAALGLTDIPAVGEPWAATLPSGDVSGEVWHLGRHQVGLTVREWGAGLLLACAARGPDPAPPDGPAGPRGPPARCRDGLPAVYRFSPASAPPPSA